MAWLLICTRSGHVAGADLVAAFGEDQVSSPELRVAGSAAMRPRPCRRAIAGPAGPRLLHCATSNDVGFGLDVVAFRLVLAAERQSQLAISPARRPRERRTARREAAQHSPPHRREQGRRSRPRRRPIAYAAPAQPVRCRGRSGVLDICSRTIEMSPYVASNIWRRSARSVSRRGYLVVLC